ncbi:MbnP family protein [Capnocytophaga cynodegmi]|uniref:MbnP family protein n=1 Tax=Capnocytophaga cynodegmi TaxID=28189 RepID=UPI00385B19C2
MKELKSVLLVLMITLVISCKKDEPNQIIEEPTGKVALEFQNVYQDSPFGLHQDNTTPPPMKQKINYSRFTYMISDISLVDDKGEEVKYYHTNPDKGAFLLVHHGNTTPKEIELKQIPIGTYTKVKLRVGLSNTAWKLGENQQQTFWNASKAVGMTWDSWSKGYKHFNLEGTWGEEGEVFSVQIGNIPSENKERSIEMTLSLPENLVVKKDETKNIRFEVNVSAVFGGKNKITITKENAIVQDESNEIFSKIIENFTANVFKAASVY